MKITTLLMLLGILPSAASATCQIEFEVQDDVDSKADYQLNYYHKSSLKTYDVGRLSSFNKMSVNLSQCPTERYSDLTLFKVNKEGNQLSFETKIFPQQRSVVFSHSNTLAFRSCVGCNWEEHKRVTKLIETQKLDKELKELFTQQPDYLSYNRYADVRATFGAKVRNIAMSEKESAYIVPPDLGLVLNDGPNARNMNKQWLNVLSPNKAFLRIFKAKLTSYSRQDWDVLETKVGQISSQFLPDLLTMTKSYHSIQQLNERTNSLLEPLKTSTDKLIVNLVSDVESTLDEVLSLNGDLDNPLVAKAELNRLKPDMIETIPANWFRLLHTIPAETPEQLAMFSNRFRADFLTKIQNRDDSLEPYIAASVKKYGKAMRYAPTGSTDKDKAAYNALIAEIKGKQTKLTNKKFSLVDTDAGYEVQWTFEDESWKLDRFILL